MKLGEGEEKIAEYYFKGGNDVANVSILTNRRLVVIYRNAEESYPLSKIVAVKIIFSPLSGLLILGVSIALLGLMMLVNGVGVGIGLLAIGGGLCYFGRKGTTRLLIRQMGGVKDYQVRGKDQKLIEFVDEVNSKLS